MGWAEDAGSASDCPTREAVALAVQGLLRQSTGHVALVDSDFEIRDFGPRYVVTVRGRTREYEDEQRDCRRRARVAAVFVALTLAPPEIGLPDLGEEAQVSPPATPEPAPAAGPVAPATPPTPAPLPTEPAPRPITTVPDRSPWRVGLEAGALAMLAPRADHSLNALGAGLRFKLDQLNWGLSLGTNLTTADDLQLGSSSIRQRRFPFDLGIHWHWGRSWLRGSFDSGLLFAVLKLQQQGVEAAPTRTRLEIGGRIGLALQLNQTNPAPFLRGHLEVVPMPHSLAVEPRGTIGDTSRLWLGLTVGLAAFFN